jgi:hypothetical protein
MQFNQLKRREFITLLGGAASWPLVARAQQEIPLIGFLHAGSPSERVHLVAAMREGLRARGYIEGQNVSAEVRLRGAKRQPLKASWKRGLHDDPLRPVGVPPRPRQGPHS